MTWESSRRTFAVLVAVLSLGLFLNAAPADAAVTITEFGTPSFTQLNGVTAGPDGNVWFVETTAHNIGTLTPSIPPVFTYEYPVANNSEPWEITTGPDGNLWFTEHQGNAIGRITTTGTLTEFPLPNPNSFPTGITAGPDGNLWFAEQIGNRVGRITPGGTITEFPNTMGSDVSDITAGPDGNLWFGDPVAGLMGRITTSGSITYFPAPANPSYVTAGPDGNIWFAGGAVGWVSTSGASHVSYVAENGEGDITPGPCTPTLFFAEGDQSRVDQITIADVLTTYKTPTTFAFPWGVTSASDGNVWFTEENDTSQLGRISGIPLHILCVTETAAHVFVGTLLQKDKLGRPVGWMMQDPGLHGVTDSSGMGLFGTPDGIPYGQTYTFTFVCAGTYRYNDPFQPSSKGVVKVPIGVALVPGTTNQALVTWASTDAPPIGFVYDVQVEQPGSSAFVDWKTGVTTPTGVLGPGDPHYVGPGTYAFRARIRNTANGAASGYSSPKQITLS
jgi:virginiamycin B lyase